MIENFIHFERGDKVRLKSDTYGRWVVLRVDIGDVPKYHPDYAKAEISQVGTGMRRYVPVNELEYAY